MKRIIIGLMVWLAAGFAIAPVAYAAPPGNISQTVGVCDPNYPKRCIAVAVDGSIAVTGGGGGGGSNAAAGLTGAAVPTSAGYTGFNVSGNLVGVSAANPLPITASGGAVGLLSGSQAIGTVSITSSALPTGASTSANQATEIASLATIATNTGNTNSVGVTQCSTVNAACVANNYQLFTNQGSTATSTTLTGLLGGGWLVDYSVGTFTSYVVNVTGPNAALTQAFSATVLGKQCITIGNGSSFNSVITSPTGFYATLEYVGTCPAATQTLVQATASVPINISTGATTQIIALAAGKSIYVTGWNVVSAGTANFSLVYGTGTNCGTGTTALTGVYNLTAQSGLAFGAGLGPVLVTPVGQALCEVDSTTVQMSGSVAYAQQ